MWKPKVNLSSIDKEKLVEQGKKLQKRYGRNPILWAVILSILGYIAWNAQSWERKSDLYDILKKGQAGYLCLSHENGIFERSGIGKAYTTTKTYIRFDRETFIRDYLKRDEGSITVLAVAVDLGGGIHWSEMTLKENQELARKFKIELGTCLSANGIHYQVPGAALVTDK